MFTTTLDDWQHRIYPLLNKDYDAPEIMQYFKYIDTHADPMTINIKFLSEQDELLFRLKYA